MTTEFSPDITGIGEASKLVASQFIGLRPAWVDLAATLYKHADPHCEPRSAWNSLSIPGPYGYSVEMNGGWAVTHSAHGEHSSSLDLGGLARLNNWGGSAGAISVGMQMLTNGGDTEGLFRVAFTSSGGPLPTGSVEHVQDRWDNFATMAGCGGFLGNDASGSIFGYYGLDVAWWPLADGNFLSASAQELVRKGSVADVSFITGDCDDDGTLFSLRNSNMSTSDELKTYLSQVVFPTVEESSIDALLAVYPDDPILGSPFDTGSNSSITPEFKRISALMGDIVFQAPRRLLLEHRAGGQHAYPYLWKGGKQSAVLGAAHTNDMTFIYAGGELLDYLIHFAVTLEPGHGGDELLEWPRYALEGRKLMTFLDGEESLTITEDTYREEAMKDVPAFNTDNPI